ncbi:FIG00765051: hypothetical protein [hydrothermal vent metagenome]|uniref:Phytanoyl-CoA dioxygenase n=1 Tax=hydrothermal vent metagenome TaxID=652676 RepID=A0A3B0TMG7_9ZZZZ
MENAFLDIEEQVIMDRFAQDGYVFIPIKDQSRLDGLRNQIFEKVKKDLDLDSSLDINEFYDYTDKYVSVDKLNQVRVSLISMLNSDSQTRPLMYALAKQYIWWIVGNELAMQRTVNLSIQLSGDTSSLLPIHSDVWMGNSPYEVVFWLPLVDCYKTKSMYVLPLGKSNEVFNDFEQYSKMSAEEFFKSIEKDAVWLDVPYGKAVVFSHSILHGNVPNAEDKTRWSFNVRFKSLLTPYADKALGESFLPITARPATKVGVNYIKPRCVV